MIITLNKKPIPIEPESPIKTLGSFLKIPRLKTKKVRIKTINGITINASFFGKNI